MGKSSLRRVYQRITACFHLLQTGRVMTKVSKELSSVMELAGWLTPEQEEEMMDLEVDTEITSNFGFMSVTNTCTGCVE